MERMAKEEKMGVKKILAGLAAAVALTAFAVPASAQVVPTGSWTTRTNATYPMYYCAGSSDGTYLYVYGGLGYYPYTMTLRFDNTANTWAVRTAMPQLVYYNRGCYGAGEAWSFGNGYYGAGYVYSYNNSTNTWTTRTALTGHIYGCAAASDGTYAYLISGYGTGYTQTTATTRYQFSTGTQTTMATAPFSNWYGHMAAYEPLNGKIYCINGTGTYEFTPPVGAGTGSWTTKTSCPATKTNGLCFTGKGRFYAHYGTTLHEYFPGGDTWTQRASTSNSYTYYGMTGAQLSSTKALINGYYYTEEYTYPNFGLDPNDATAVQQIGSLGVTPQAGSDPNAGWTNTQMTFSANCSDPDVGQNVRLEVQVKKASDPWTLATQVNSVMGPQGVHTVTYTAPTGDNYDWRYHVADDYYNYNPNTGGVPGWHEFMKNTVTPDFRSDQVPPTAPVPLYPVSQDVNVPSLVAGDVPFSWTASTDNGPSTAITYQIEVAHNDSSFGSLAASQVGIVPTNVTINLPVSRYDYSYRLRAQDIGGNVSAWSTVTTFRVVGDDGLNHSAGDAKKWMGCSSLAGTGSIAGALAGLALAGLAAIRSLRRK